ncbi:unnamed protein product [Moneuplotes crassus]|uniref:Uncharacterized protein n=1 Tax=Euplotes crassus TaxID=5936 RepID=A0AAD1Y5K6_EUPCR|nr:unnamed protein product [Moneuplotes crassus]
MLSQASYWCQMAFNNEEKRRSFQEFAINILVGYRSNLVIMLPRLVTKYCD